mgnify:CR=1 FL=1
MLTSGAMSKIWGMINSMQISSHIPVLQFFLPVNSSEIVLKVFEIASFEVIELGKYVFEDLELLKIPENDGELVEERCKQAVSLGLESYYFIVNMGTLFVAFIGSVTIPLVLYFLLKPCISRSRYISARH